MKPQQRPMTDEQIIAALRKRPYDKAARKGLTEPVRGLRTFNAELCHEARTSGSMRNSTSV